MRSMFLHPLCLEQRRINEYIDFYVKIEAHETYIHVQYI
jgi:hypothetical protein